MNTPNPYPNSFTNAVPGVTTDCLSWDLDDEEGSTSGPMESISRPVKGLIQDASSWDIEDNLGIEIEIPTSAETDFDKLFESILLMIHALHEADPGLQLKYDEQGTRITDTLALIVRLVPSDPSIPFEHTEHRLDQIQKALNKLVHPEAHTI